MKNIRKFMSIILVLALTIVGTIGATVAYLTDSEKAKNTFTVGDVAITLDEAAVKTGKNDGGFFSYVEDTSKGRVTGNTYTNLIPGSTIYKDPTVTNVGSSDAYIRVTLKHNNNAAIFTYFTEEEFLASVVGLEDTIRKTAHMDVAWKLANGNYGANSGNIGNYETELKPDQKVYVFYFKDPLASGGTIELFRQINVPESFDSAEMAAFKNLEIDITADAIQVSGFDNVKEAFAAFDAQ